MSAAPDVDALRTVAAYQFGAGAGDALFPDSDGAVTVRRSSSGRPRQVVADGERLVSYRTDGRFTLGVAGGRRLRAALGDAYSVTVGDESAPFVRDGKNAFAKFVSAADPAVRPRDEVSVVHEDGTLLAVGRAELAASEMRDFDTGMAVKVRSGVGPE